MLARAAEQHSAHPFGAQIAAVDVDDLIGHGRGEGIGFGRIVEGDVEKVFVAGEFQGGIRASKHFAHEMILLNGRIVDQAARIKEVTISCSAEDKLSEL